MLLGLQRQTVLLVIQLIQLSKRRVVQMAGCVDVEGFDPKHGLKEALAQPHVARGSGHRPRSGPRYISRPNLTGRYIAPAFCGLL